MPNITKRFVEAIEGRQPPGKTKLIYDDSLTGFGIRITTKGVVSYILQYRNQGGGVERMTLGKHRGKVQQGKYTTPQARKIADGLMVRVGNGENPAQDKKKRRDAPTLREFEAEYFEWARTREKKPLTEASINAAKFNLENQIYPAIRETTKVVDVDKDHVLKLLKKFRGQPGTFNRAKAVLSGILTYAEKEGLRPQNENPCKQVDKLETARKERFLIPDEVARLGNAIDEAERTQTANQYQIAALRLLMLTGARRGEILKLKWSHVNFDHKCLYLPTSKTGEKEIMLSDAAIKVLEGIEQQDDNEYVICGTKKGHHLYDLKGCWNRIRKSAGLEDVRVHDLRHTFASEAAKNGIPLAVIAKLLGHASTRTTEIYSHIAQSAEREAMEKTASKIQEASKQPVPDGKIVPFSTKAS